MVDSNREQENRNSLLSLIISTLVNYIKTAQISQDVTWATIHN